MGAGLAVCGERIDLPTVPVALGPRGPVGPDVSLGEAEGKRLAPRIAVEGGTAAAVRTACERAVKEGVKVVFLPAGEYVFESTVSVPGGVTLLGEGSKTLIRTIDRKTRLFSVGGDNVRFTRLKLQGADTTPNQDNNTFGIVSSKVKNVRIDHCELLGFSYVMDCTDDATVQVDHCRIHHNLRNGYGYGVAVYNGAYVLVTDNEFSQNRHSLASNGALDWAKGYKERIFRHIPGVRKCHWEFIHNRVNGNDKAAPRLWAVDSHPGMDGSFVIEGNIFENLSAGIGIRDGFGIVRGNLFYNFQQGRGDSVIRISATTHNGIQVENAIPHDIQLAENTFVDVEQKLLIGHADKPYKWRVYWEICQAQNITVDGKILAETRKDRKAPPPVIWLQEMSEDGVLKWREARPAEDGIGGVEGVVTDEAGKPIAGATVYVGDRSATTDAAGRFSFAEVTAAAHFVAATKMGFDIGLAGLAVRPGQRSTVNVRLSPDRKPPIIFDVTVTKLIDKSASVVWRTDELATSEVVFGDRTQPESKPEPAKIHSAELASLTPDTAYRFRITAKDASGNVGASDEITFRTSAVRAEVPADLKIDLKD